MASAGGQNTSSMSMSRTVLSAKSSPVSFLGVVGIEVVINARDGEGVRVVGVDGVDATLAKLSFVLVEVGVGDLEGVAKRFDIVVL